jgi:hypothetical protein
VTRCRCCESRDKELKPKDVEASYTLGGMGGGVPKEGLKVPQDRDPLSPFSRIACL